MKRLFRSAVLVLAAAVLTACMQDEPVRPRPGAKKGGFNRPPTTITENLPPDETERPPPREHTPPPENPAPPKITENVESGNPPYAKPVPGKTGFVTSPYGSTKDYIDVRGFPPGTPVKDPYSQKTILVP